MVITWGFHSRNSGSSPDIGIRRDTAQGAFVSIAQTVERATVNRKATGSIPVRNVGWRKQLKEQIKRFL